MTYQLLGVQDETFRPTTDVPRNITKVPQRGMAIRDESNHSRQKGEKRLALAQQCTVKPTTKQQHSQVFWLLYHSDLVRGFHVEPTGAIRVIFWSSYQDEGERELKSFGLRSTVDEVYLIDRNNKGNLRINANHVVKYAYLTKDNHLVVNVSKKSCAMM